MEIKKDPQVDLEPRKTTYWLTGLAGILAILFIAFEWTNVTHQTKSLGFGDAVIEEEEEDNATVEVIQQVVETGPAEEEEADANQIFTVVEQEPEFPGGTKALMEYISKNLRYPAFAAENGIQGRVTLSFVVEKDGSVTDIQELRSPSEDLTKEAKRVVQSMPKWKPGKQRGKPVRVKYMLPVTFRLQ